jgi:hypothetical protein
METGHHLEMNGNLRRGLGRSETDSVSGTQSEPSNTRAKPPQKVATWRCWVRPLNTCLYSLRLTGIACG